MKELTMHEVKEVNGGFPILIYWGVTIAIDLALIAMTAGIASGAEAQAAESK